MQKIFLILVTLLIATSCSKKVKEKIGIASAGPDEYKVLRGKALEVPPHYDLPNPHGYIPAEHNEIPANLNDGERELIKEINGTK
jgi:hypothetical protein